MELDRVGVDVEAALLELMAGAEIDHGADAELAQDVQIGLGQLAQAVGPEQHPPAGAQAVHRGVAAEVTEVHRPFELDDPVDRHLTGRSHNGNQRLRSVSTGRSTPSMVRMRSSSSVSRRSFWLSTGANG